MNRAVVKASAGIITIILTMSAYTQKAHFGYLEEPVNPRATGMGCAGTAKSTGGFSFYNPAAVATIESSFVAFEYGQQWSDISRGLVETAWLFPKWFMGASFQTQSINFELVDDFGNRLPGSSSEQASLLSLQIGWRDVRYAIGAAINGLHHHLYDGNAYALSASGGVTVTVLPGKLLAGAALIQAGAYHRGFFQTQFEVKRNITPTTGRIGCSWNDTIIGKLPITLMLDAAYSSNFHTVTVPAGIEIRPIRPLAVRVGKRFNFATELFTLGVGISWENLSFDASFIPSTLQDDLETRWLMGLRYTLAAGKKPPAQKKSIEEPFPAGDTSVDRAMDTVISAPASMHSADSQSAAGHSAEAATPIHLDSAAGIIYQAVDSVNLPAKIPSSESPAFPENMPGSQGDRGEVSNTPAPADSTTTSPHVPSYRLGSDGAPAAPGGERIKP